MATADAQGGRQPPQSSTTKPPMNTLSFADPLSLLDPSIDDLTTDWTQWMRWDELDLDPISGHVNLSASPIESMNTSEGDQTMAPSDLDLSPYPKGSSCQSISGISPHGSVSPPQIPRQSCPPLDPSQMFTFRPDMANHQGRNSISSVPATTLRPSGNPAKNTPIAPLAPSPSFSLDRKRKSIADESELVSGAATPASKTLPSKKRSHNVIEKRYRANLNEKIAELRDSVPSLRALARQRSGSANGEGDENDAEITTSANKLNKASILSKATEYIKHLELRNKRLDEENLALKNRLRQLEKAQEQSLTNFNFAPGSISSPESYSVSTDSGAHTSPGVFSHTEEFSPDSPQNSLYPPEGLIKVPDYLKRMRPTGPQPHYADSHYGPPAGGGGGGSILRRGMPNKFMLGTLAGLMIVGGFENQKKTQSTERGLFALPLQMTAILYRHFQWLLYGFTSASWQIRALFRVSMTVLIFIGCTFLVFLYLFNSRPRRPRGSKLGRSSMSQTLGSSGQFRREAWLTSIQTVWVPNHNFFPEWFAVTSRCVEYMLRCMLGWNLYSQLTGITEDDEKGRLKAWDIALDAQLTGGDAEISKSRLVLTIFAAGTLPRSPARMILKALHCRVLLWRVGRSGSLTCALANRVACILAKYQWQLAQKMQKGLPEGHDDLLPPHLAALLENDIEVVMTDAILQRASNMTWNRPTQEATDGEDSMLDVVVEDTTVRSPLDALASWWSSRKLQDALIHCLEFDTRPCDKTGSTLFENNLDLALKSAPFASAAYTRAAVVKAVFFDEDRVTNINSVLAALPRSKHRPSISSTNFVDSSVPPSARVEISIAVRCAMIAAILKGQAGTDPSEPSQLSLHNAIDLFNVLPVDPVELTLLGFSSLYHLLHIVANEERLLPPSPRSSSICSSSDLSTSTSSSLPSTTSSPLPTPDLARIASGLIYWVRNAYNPISSGFTTELMDAAVQGCVDICSGAGIEVDAKQSDLEGHRRKKNNRRKQTIKSTAPTETSSDAVALSAEEILPINKPRRGSVRSEDTGYGSLSQEGDKDRESSPDNPSIKVEQA
ncbi:hypothetical protein AJ80_00651 [Polytolypa hystricis UAMH7299]|uniref:BHLH domain-containing protein n=1 Tax=Polytolypa hystricis (strain UAMH7299) TaxID=1447883 RepID=A0A2B7Z3D5_POLH7|nr:hypothetical protein AJ80_00651 [Polytolypa hystricis UAMH7299]